MTEFRNRSRRRGDPAIMQAASVEYFNRRLLRIIERDPPTCAAKLLHDAMQREVESQ